MMFNPIWYFKQKLQRKIKAIEEIIMKKNANDFIHVGTKITWKLYLY